MHSQSEEDYIKTIYYLGLENKVVSTNDIASNLKTKPSSVSDMLKKLANKKYIYYKKYNGSSLTKKGKEIALSIIRKHRLWETFLVNQLGFGWDKVHMIAEQLEHIKSEELIDKLDEFLNFPKYDPHGDPIPTKLGKIEQKKQRLLSELKANENGIITGVKKGTPSLLNFLDKEQINLGDHLIVKEIIEFDGSYYVQINKINKVLSDKICNNLLIENND